MHMNVSLIFSNCCIVFCSTVFILSLMDLYVTSSFYKYDKRDSNEYLCSFEHLCEWISVEENFRHEITRTRGCLHI
jgi:hypothetical protein